MKADIHLCRHDEIEQVERFIEKYWAAGHVLAHDRELMDWQHLRRDGSYNFVVATRDADPEPLAILGFIPSTRFDAALGECETVWLALWKVRPGTASAGLGLGVLRYMTAMHPDADIGVVGIGPDEHLGMYRALGFTVGRLSQHYMLSSAHRDFLLADVPSTTRRRPPGGTARLTRLSEEDFAARTANVAGGCEGRARPSKTPEYFRARFFGHPVYTYAVYLVEGEAGSGLLAARLASHSGRTALRIVDYLGDELLFAHVGRAVQDLIEESGSEYADVWNAGFAASTFEQAGFSLVDPAGEVVIPNYFEPFQRKNGHIAFALRAGSAAPLVVFRADGDQDRPNVIAGRR